MLFHAKLKPHHLNTLPDLQRNPRHPPSSRLLTHHTPPPLQPLRPPPIQRLRHETHMLHARLLLATRQALLGRNLSLLLHLPKMRVLRVEDEFGRGAGFAGMLRLLLCGRGRRELLLLLWRQAVGGFGRRAGDFGHAAGVGGGEFRGRGGEEVGRVGVDEGGGCGGGDAWFFARAAAALRSLVLLGEESGGEFGVVGDALDHAFHEEEFAFGVEFIESAPGFGDVGEGFAAVAVGCCCLCFLQGGFDAFCVGPAAEDGFFRGCYDGSVGALLGLRRAVFGFGVEDAVLW